MQQIDLTNDSVTHECFQNMQSNLELKNSEEIALYIIDQNCIDRNTRVFISAGFSQNGRFIRIVAEKIKGNDAFKVSKEKE